MGGKNVDSYPKLNIWSDENSVNKIWFTDISEKSSILGKPKNIYRYVLDFLIKILNCELHL